MVHVSQLPCCKISVRSVVTDVDATDFKKRKRKCMQFNIRTLHQYIFFMCTKFQSLINQGKYSLTCFSLALLKLLHQDNVSQTETTVTESTTLQQPMPPKIPSLSFATDKHCSFPL